MFDRTETQTIMVEMVDPIDRMIGHYLIEMLDEAGHVSSDLGAAAEKLGCTKDRLLETLSKLQPLRRLICSHM